MRIPIKIKWQDNNCWAACAIQIIIANFDVFCTINTKSMLQLNKIMRYYLNFIPYKECILPFTTMRELFANMNFDISLIGGDSRYVLSYFGVPFVNSQDLKLYKDTPLLLSVYFDGAAPLLPKIIYINNKRYKLTAQVINFMRTPEHPHQYCICWPGIDGEKGYRLDNKADDIGTHKKIKQKSFILTGTLRDARTTTIDGYNLYINA
jgi:hypothetical protein